MRSIHMPKVTVVRLTEDRWILNLEEVWLSENLDQRVSKLDSVPSESLVIGLDLTDGKKEAIQRRAMSACLFLFPSQEKRSQVPTSSVILGDEVGSVLLICGDIGTLKKGSTPWLPSLSLSQTKC